MDPRKFLWKNGLLVMSVLGVGSVAPGALQAASLDSNFTCLLRIGG